MKNRAIIAALAIAAMVGCTKEQNSSTDNSDSIIEFTSQSISTRVNSNGDEWEEGDKIGVFMKVGGNVEASNIKYEALTGGESTTRFVPSDVDKALEYAESGEMTFYAYYPYDQTLGSDYLATIDCSSTTVSSDFLWATTTGNRGEVISLPFEHKMSRLVLVFTPLESVSSLAGLEAEISDVMTIGYYDLTLGKFEGIANYDSVLEFTTEEYMVDSEADSGYSLCEAGDNADMVIASVILPPQALQDKAPVDITIGDRTFSVNIPSDEFISGYIRSYNVTVGNDYVDFDGGSTISKWGETIVGDSELYGDYNDTSATE